MLIYAGIDEAGYGPMLGPLCVGGTAFVLAEHAAEDGAPDLWRCLKKSVCRNCRDTRRRVAIEDSKRLKGASGGRSHPLRHLERGVLSFCSAWETLPPSDDELFHLLLGSVPERRWYRSSSPLPLAHDEGQLRIAASRLVRNLAEAGVACAWMRCRVIDAGDFNTLVDRMGNKACVNFSAAMGLVDEIWRRWSNEHPRVIVDRQGGRTHYREDLQFAWPEASIRILAESEAMSRYRLTLGRSTLTITFQKEAETGHLPVALASMIAKYVRELFMLRLNRFFQGEMPGLRPTAGYVADARRYLTEIEPVIKRLQVPRPELIRAV